MALDACRAKLVAYPTNNGLDKVKTFMKNYMYSSTSMYNNPGVNINKKKSSNFNYGFQNVWAILGGVLAMTIKLEEIRKVIKGRKNYYMSQTFIFCFYQGYFLMFSFCLGSLEISLISLSISSESNIKYLIVQIVCIFILDGVFIMS